MADLIRAALVDMKALSPQYIDLTGRCDFTDLMVIAGGTSSRHVASIAHRVINRLREAGVTELGVEGMEYGDWVLIDAGDAVIHLFRPEMRDFYNLERMWMDPDAPV